VAKSLSEADITTVHPTAAILPLAGDGNWNDKQDKWPDADPNDYGDAHDGWDWGTGR
jgi:hypothetical protein